MRERVVLGLALVLLVSGSAEAQRRSRSYARHSSGGVPCGRSYISASETCHVGSSTTEAPRSRARARQPGESRRYVAPGETRDARGRLRRSESAKEAFERATGHPHGWPGHVVDQIVPLACGGADDPFNMQWQTTAAGKAKDKVERRGCARAP